MSLNIDALISRNDTEVLGRPNEVSAYVKSPWLVQKAVFHWSPTTILVR